MGGEERRDSGRRADSREVKREDRWDRREDDMG
jgi:hypothetical protein